MKSDNRFMNELFRIVNGALRLDVDEVRNYTAFLADNLEKDGDTASASRLRKMLDETDRQLRPAETALANALPVDAESRFPLIERVNLKALHEPPVLLPQDQWDVVNEFLSIAKSYGQINALDAAGALSFLIYGPPGTGKSRLARFIALELGLELYVARLDGLISSFLGSTSKNIRALFEFAARTPCVLFLDEFDAIAKLRGDSQELGELKRVVNSFLQNLDTIGRQSIILAATNHEGLLDDAVWRRFSYRLELRFPDAAMRRQMWVSFNSPLNLKKRDLGLLVDLSDGFSGSDIQEVCLRLRRRQITSGTTPQLTDAFQILRNIAIGGGEDRRFVSRLKVDNLVDSARELRERDAKLYSLSAVAELFGVSKSTVHRLAPKGTDHDG
jgi:MoxR-like ATPase